ncbi:MAG TPA: MFS transporter [Candidatus Binataceae bacterium]
MSKEERRGWIIIAALFVNLLVVFGGGYNSGGVFLTPLIKQFGWSHAQVSSLQATLALAAGIFVVPVGWLLDRVEARVVMVGGIVLAGLGYLVASRADSYALMLGAYSILGVGIAAGTLLPASMVAANWFEAKRGLALGVTMAGTALGGSLMTLVATRAIMLGGWRAGYVALAVPMFVVAIPVVLLIVRTRPAASSTASVSVADGSANLPGLEVGEALRGRSFWMICIAQFCFALAVAGGGLHLITYLINVGYTPLNAARVMSTLFLTLAVGKLGYGFFSDRFSGRASLFVALSVTAVGLLLVLTLSNRGMLIPFIIVFGLSFGAPLVLVPVVMVESLGLRRFGSLSGLAGLPNTLGAFLGPVIGGRLFDVTGSYTLTFELFALILFVGAISVLGCIPLSRTQATQATVAAPSPTAA